MLKGSARLFNTLFLTKPTEVFKTNDPSRLALLVLNRDPRLDLLKRLKPYSDITVASDGASNILYKAIAKDASNVESCITSWINIWFAISGEVGSDSRLHCRWPRFRRSQFFGLLQRARDPSTPERWWRYYRFRKRVWIRSGFYSEENQNWSQPLVQDRCALWFQWTFRSHFEPSSQSVQRIKISQPQGP